jgi:thioredoxin reductase
LVSALSAACYLAKAGHEVVVLKKIHHWRKSKTIKGWFTFDNVGTGRQMFSIVSLIL